MLGAACPFRGAPTARSQRWPGCPWGGFTPVAGADVVTGAWLLAGWLAGVVVTAGRLAGAAALLFLVPEPALQAVNKTDAKRREANNLYMVNDLGGN